VFWVFGWFGRRQTYTRRFFFLLYRHTFWGSTKVTFTPPNIHDSTQTEKLVSYDEKALFEDKAYVNGDH